MVVFHQVKVRSFATTVLDCLSRLICSYLRNHSTYYRLIPPQMIKAGPVFCSSYGINAITWSNEINCEQWASGFAKCLKLLLSSWLGYFPWHGNDKCLVFLVAVLTPYTSLLVPQIHGRSTVRHTEFIKLDIIMTDNYCLLLFSQFLAVIYVRQEDAWKVSRLYFEQPQLHPYIVTGAICSALQLWLIFSFVLVNCYFVSRSRQFYD